MPSMLGIYLSPDFEVVWGLLDSIAAQRRIGVSTLCKQALIEWAQVNGLDPDLVVQKDQETQIRREISKQNPCRFRLMTSPTTIVCKARAPTMEQKPLSACIDCEDYQHDPLR